METPRTLFTPLMQGVILSFFIGGLAGYGIRIFHEVSFPAHPSTGSSSAPGGQAGGGGYPGGGMGGMMGGGMMGGGQPRSGAQIVRLVRSLDTIEKVQHKQLTPGQSAALLPILKALKAADKIPDKEAEAQLSKINAVLTEDQKKTIQDLQPGPRGGPGGGPGGPPGRAPAPAGPPAGGRMAGGGMGMGGGGMGGMMGGGGMAGNDPEKPFANDRSRQPLEDLLTRLQTPGK